jgi:hypothetical protein
VGGWPGEIKVFSPRKKWVHFSKSSKLSADSYSVDMAHRLAKLPAKTVIAAIQSAESAV